MTGSFVLTPPDRPRPYAIGAVLDLAGAALVVLGLERETSWLLIVGVVLFALGTGLALAALVVRQRLRTVVELDDNGLVIRSGGQRAAAIWGDISGVSSDQRSIYLERKNDQPPLKITSPRGVKDPQAVALSAELARRLDQSRGYHPL